MTTHANGVHRKPAATRRSSTKSHVDQPVAPTPSSAAPPKKLLDDLLGDNLDLRPIAQRHGLTLAQLARWAERPNVARAMRRLRQLSDARANLIVSRNRVGAAHQLLKLAMGEETGVSSSAGETARKACVDLLKLGNNALIERPVAAEPVATSTIGVSQQPSTEELDAVRALLEALGSAASQDHSSDDAQPETAEGSA